jgi:DNA-binding Lrp family transcriptional regulator
MHTGGPADYGAVRLTGLGSALAVPVVSWPADRSSVSGGRSRYSGSGVALPETDLALVDAVQVNPRASWARIGAVLGVSPVTAARRWGSLTDAGVAWTSSVMGARLSCGAILEIASRPGRADSIIEALSEIPSVFTVGRTTGRFDLHALAVAPSIAALQALVFDATAGLDAHQISSHVYTKIHGGLRWRLNVLDPSQTERLREIPLRPLPQTRLGPADRQLYLALAGDARRSYNDLADQLGTTPQAVRRQLERMRRGGYIDFRTDMAFMLSGRPLRALLWLKVPDRDLDTVGRELGGWSETRVCATVASAANIVLVVSLRTPEHLEEIVMRLANTHPGIDVIDRRLMLSMSKIHGHILDEVGRTRRVVPVDPWAHEDLAQGL